MNVPRLRISNTLRERMKYAKAASPTLRMLVLESRYWLDGACTRAAARMGWQTRTVRVVAAGVLPRDVVAELLTAVVDFLPDFILTINHSGMVRSGLFANLFSDLGVPLVSWFVDDPRTILMNDSAHASPGTLALTWESAYIPYFHDLGFTHVYHVPLAADTRFAGAPDPAPTIPGAFVGNSMIEFADRQRQRVSETPGLLDTVDAAFAQGRVTRERFAEGLAAILGDATVAPLDEEARRHAEMYCFVEGTRRLRHELAERLCPEGMLVRGDELWRRSFPLAGPAINYDRDLPAFYRSCAVNANTTSIQMAAAVNQRVFDAPAAGGFILTDNQADMQSLFEPGVESVTYDSFDECVDKFRYYRDHPSARIPIIEAAQKRIAAHHTYHHRLETIAHWIRQHFAD